MSKHIAVTDTSDKSVKYNFMLEFKEKDSGV